MALVSPQPLLLTLSEAALLGVVVVVVLAGLTAQPQPLSRAALAESQVAIQWAVAAL